MDPAGPQAARLRSWQLRIVALGWVTYAAYYLGRVNISTAIPELRDSLGLSAESIGLLTSGFFFAYAVGQLVSGYLGDRLSPRRLVAVGMLISAVLNLLFGVLAGTLPLLIVWTLNGFAQATGWAPIMRVLTNWHPPDQRRRVAGVYATSFVAGNALTWLFAGWLVTSFGWRFAFLIPGLLLALFALIWAAAARDRPEGAGLALPEAAGGSAGGHGSAPELTRVLLRFWPLALTGVCGGSLLIPLVVWLPTYFVDELGLSVAASANLSALLPVAGVAGTLSFSWLVASRFRGREIGFALVWFLILAGIALLFPLASGSFAASVALLIVLGATVYGVSTLILITTPMLFSDREETASVAGVIDFSHYIGASIASALIGIIVARWSWFAAFGMLSTSAVLASLALAVFAWWRGGGGGGRHRGG
ncbi:MAG: MFS transporter [Truepera sp.]|nr:MFS transporter [Truepera sp.]